MNRIRQMRAETLQEFREQATSIGIDIPLAEGIIGLSGSDATKASKFKTTFDSFKLDQRAEERAYELYSARMATVNTSLVQSWGRCADQYLDAFMRLNAKGVFLDVIPFDNSSQFTARISVRSDRRHNIEIRSISPDGTACVSNFGQQVTASITFDTATFLMTCRKDPVSKIPFAVTTDEGPTNTVNVPARTSRLTELEEHLGTLESRIATLVPRGTIVAWHSSSGPVPDGWALCDGTNGTPDLRNRFLMGVGEFTAVGSIGGANALNVPVPIGRLYLATGGTDHDYALREDPGCNGCGITNHRTGVNYLVNSFTKDSQTSATFDNRPAYVGVVYIMKL